MVRSLVLFDAFFFQFLPQSNEKWRQWTWMIIGHIFSREADKVFQISLWSRLDRLWRKTYWFLEAFIILGQTCLANTNKIGFLFNKRKNKPKREKNAILFWFWPIIQPKYSFVSIIGLLYNYANIAKNTVVEKISKSLIF